MSDEVSNPLAYAFGPRVAFLSPEEASRATVDERIASIWPYVGERVKAFMKTMDARERANFDYEDSILECWVAIRERDHLYSSRIGLYISFAAPIIQHCLYRVREESRTIVSAKNAPYRIRKATEKAKRGALTRRCGETLAAIVASTSSPSTLDAEADHLVSSVMAVGGGQSAVDDAEEAELSIDAIIDGILCLSPYEAVIVGQSSGLWGQPPRSIAEIAHQDGRTEASVRAVRRKALVAIREYLEARGHPAASPDFPAA